MDFITFLVMLSFIYGLARITANVNWKEELKDVKGFFSNSAKKHL